MIDTYVPEISKVVRAQSGVTRSVSERALTQRAVGRSQREPGSICHISMVSVRLYCFPQPSGVLGFLSWGE